MAVIMVASFNTQSCNASRMESYGRL